MRSMPLVLALALVLCTAALALAQVDYTGRWQDPETLTVFTIEHTPDGPIMTSVIDDDGEEFALVASSLRPESVSFVYFVPSTEYIVIFDCVPGAGVMTCRWYNDADMEGHETLTRIGN